MPHLRTVHEHLGQSTAAHRHTHQEALREAAVARAQLEAASATPGPTEAAEEVTDDG